MLSVVEPTLTSDLTRKAAGMERKDELEARVRETPLSERLSDCRKRIGKMCSEGRPPRMCIPVQWDDDDFYISTTLADAQRALDVERERVKGLEEWQRVVVGTGTDQEAVVRMAATEYTKTAVQCWKDENAKLTAQLATLQAQLRQVEGERDVDDLIDCCINDVLVTHATPGGKPHDPDPQIRPLRDKIAGALVELQTLRQLVEA